MDLNVDQVEKLLLSNCLFCSDRDELFYANEDSFEGDGTFTLNSSATDHYCETYFLEGAKLEGVFVSFLSWPYGEEDSDRERVHFRVFRQLNSNELIDLV